MTSRTFRSLAALFCTAASLAIGPPETAAQSAAESLTRAELERSSAPQLYDAVAELRPDWLLLGGDPATPGAADGVVVFLDGRHIGNVLALRGILTEQVVAARVRSQSYVRRTNPRFPRQEFAAAIYVSTRGHRSAPTGRITVSLDGGFSPRSLPHVVRDALQEAGYTRESALGPLGDVKFLDKGTPFPPSIGGGVYIGMRGALGVGATAQHTLKGWTGGYDADRGHAVSAFITTTEAAVLLTASRSAVRLGVGPSVRTVKWDWSEGFCQCSTPETSNSTAAGAALEMAALLPVGASRVMPQFRLLARWYPTHDPSYGELPDEVDAGGFTATLSLGIATRF